MRSRNPFTTIKTSGLLLPVDLLARIAEDDPGIHGLDPKDYHLRSGERLSEAAARAWNECKAAWQAFRTKFALLPASDAGTTVTRDEWLLPLFQELRYGRLQTKPTITIDEKEYPVSHGWESHVPIHLLSARYSLDRRTPGVAGAATRSPYSLVQELLNRSVQHRWGFVSNGLKLFLLRDNAALARAANVEFDLEAMMESGDSCYADFQVLFYVCHQSRVEILRIASKEEEAGRPENCWLEKWSNLAGEQGTRAREKLRDGVETAIGALGAGFLASRGNAALRERLSDGTLTKEDFYRQLLRLVYRLLMLLVAEEKKTENGDNLLHPPETPTDVRERYARFYSIGRLRTLADERRGSSHVDLYQSLKILFLKLRDGYAPLGIPGLGSFLFSERSTPDLDTANLSNEVLLDCIRQLCFTQDTSGRGGAVRRPVDFGNLGSEELGSVYESLLELHPQIDTDEGPFTLATAAGHERKTTGSYYTPTSLINCLLDSALDPVVAEAIDKPDPKQAEEALLNLKVCDPASGSGHFLIAAAERMATHLARLRTGDDQPSTLDIQHAKRDIIGRCIYGVDLNPMAVELCKVSLWMEALEPGRPLSFLDHHIHCGNSLLGTTPALLAKGIPDDAFKPIEGDVKAVCTELKKNNKRERQEYQSGQGYLFDPPYKLGNLPASFARLSSGVDDSVADVAEKERRYANLVSGADYQNARLLADTWCAVFVWQKDTSDLGRLCPTERDFRKIENNPHSILPHVKSEVRRLADQYQFFHWHLAFPDVFRLPGEGNVENEQTGWNSGFNVVLGNPPWDRYKVQDKEWFAHRVPEVANAKNSAARKKLIDELATESPDIYADYVYDRRRAEATSAVIRQSGAYPLCGRGDVNTYSVFAELNRNIAASEARVGCIVPTGIATDDTTRFFFHDLMSNADIAHLFSFWEIRRFFPGTDSRIPFCLLTLAKGRDRGQPSEFAFDLHSLSELADAARRFELNKDDIWLFNPISGTCPVFTFRQDFSLSRTLHARSEPIESSEWAGFYMRLIDMGDHSEHLLGIEDFPDDVPDETFQLKKNGDLYDKLYEAKLINLFDHRFATFDGVCETDLDGGNPRDLTVSEHQHSDAVVKPRYWVARELFSEIYSKYDDQRGWLLAYRDITNAASERTCVVSAIPAGPATRSLPVLGAKTDSARYLALGNLGSFFFDYGVRQKIGGNHLTFGIIKQSPILPPAAYQKESWSSFILPRVLELTYTRAGEDGSLNSDPCLLTEMFPSPRDAVDYIMETFPIVKRKDIARTKVQNDSGEITQEGRYITKDTILEIYDEMAAAIRTGERYQTRLDPPPGPPADAEGNFIPMAVWGRGNCPPHIHPPRDQTVGDRIKRSEGAAR